MTPIDFIDFDRDSYPNTPVYDITKAMKTPIKICGAESDFTILGYYFHNNQMILEIEKESRCLRESFP